eukprot:6205837-Pleurochrysis_carterae.AAC.3
MGCWARRGHVTIGPITHAFSSDRCMHSAIRERSPSLLMVTKACSQTAFLSRLAASWLHHCGSESAPRSTRLCERSHSGGGDSGGKGTCGGGDGAREGGGGDGEGGGGGGGGGRGGGAG